MWRVLDLQLVCTALVGALDVSPRHVDWETAPSGTRVSFRPGLYHGYNVSVPAGVTLAAANTGSSDTVINCQQKSRHFHGIDDNRTGCGGGVSSFSSAAVELFIGSSVSHNTAGDNAVGLEQYTQESPDNHSHHVSDRRRHVGSNCQLCPPRPTCSGDVTVAPKTSISTWVELIICCTVAAIVGLPRTRWLRDGKCPRYAGSKGGRLPSVLAVVGTIAFMLQSTHVMGELRMKPALNVTCLCSACDVWETSPDQDWWAVIEAAPECSTIVMLGGTYHGPCDVTLPTNVVLKGDTNSGRATIDCQDASRHFTIPVGANVRINGISLINGLWFGSDGSSTPGGGCLLVNEGAQLSLVNVFIRRCSAKHGGAVLSHPSSEVVFWNTTVQDCYAEVHGAVLHSSSSTVCIEESSFVMNEAGSRGGGVYVSTGSLMILDSQISHNVAEAGAGIGAELSSTVILYNVVISYNVATWVGAGIALDLGTTLFASGSRTVIAYNFIEGGRGAGGLAVETNSYAELAHGACISYNYAGISGGVRIDGSTFTVTNSTISHNTAGRGSGGGINVHNGGTLKLLDGAKVEFNHARFHGGGIFIIIGYDYHANSVTVEARDSSISYNSADDSGGGMFVEENAWRLVELQGVEIIGNFAGGKGGGIQVAGSSFIPTFRIHSISICENSALDGGGLHLNLIVVDFSRSLISNNSAYVGGGVFVINSEVTVSNTSQIIDNRAIQMGGGLHVTQGTTLFLENASIVHNTAGDMGGGIHCVQSSVLLQGTSALVLGNSAGAGGGIFVSSDGLITTMSALISTNTAAKGGGLYITSSKVYLLNDTLVFNNSAVENGGGMLLELGSVAYCRGDFSVSHNVANRRGGGIFASDGSTVQFWDSAAVDSNYARLAGGGASLLSVSSIFIQSDTSVIFTSNVADHSGGALHASASSHIVNYGQLELRGNVAGINGGACHLETSSSLTSGTLHEHDSDSRSRIKVLSNTAGSGGGIAVLGGATVTILSSSALFSNNTAFTNGGALACLPAPVGQYSTVQLLNTEFDGNVAHGDGGAVFSIRTVLFLSNGTTRLRNNSSPTGRGGGLAIAGANVIVEYGHDVEISYNSAAYGGGIALLDGAAVVLAEGSPCNPACLEHMRGDGKCDAACMSVMCNFDNGDCAQRFERAAEDSLIPCDRAKCSLESQTFSACDSDCLTASCDWSRLQCAEVVDAIKHCPLLDAVAYWSITEHRRLPICPRGTYQHGEGCVQCFANADALAGSIDPGACSCNAGYVGDGISNCEACPAGTYQDAAGASTCTLCKCITCDVGKYSTATAATSEGTCSMCEPGKFQNATGLSVCKMCAQNADSTAGSASCFCNAGFYGDGVNSCVECQVGKYAKGGSLALVCSACPAGTYSDASGASACASCEAGKFQSATGSADCEACIANADSPAGSAAESACFCKTGFFGDGVSSCEACQTGKYKLLGNNVSSSSFTCSGMCPCTPSSGLWTGSFSDGPEDYASSQTCSWVIASVAEITVRFTSFDTESGYDFVTINRCTSADCSTKEQVASLSGSAVIAETAYSSSTGFLQVEFVSDGSVTSAGFEAAWSVAEMGGCAVCPAGTYQDAAGASACTSCEAGKFLNRTGSSTEADCEACATNANSTAGSASCFCKAGFYGDGISSCAACQVGKYAKASALVCSACPAGTYEDASGASACTLCESGKYSNQTGSTAEAVCEACIANANSTAGSMSCFCEAGFYGNGVTTCEPCQAGTYGEGVAYYTISVGGGNYPEEMSVEIRDSTRTVVVTVTASQSPLTVSLSLGEHMVLPFDSYGDGWNGGSAEVSDGSSTVICITSDDVFNFGGESQSKTFSVTDTSCTPCPEGSISPSGSSSPTECSEYRRRLATPGGVGNNSSRKVRVAKPERELRKSALFQTSSDVKGKRALNSEDERQESPQRSASLHRRTLSHPKPQNPLKPIQENPPAIPHSVWRQDVLKRSSGSSDTGNGDATSFSAYRIAQIGGVTWNTEWVGPTFMKGGTSHGFGRCSLHPLTKMSSCSLPDLGPAFSEMRGLGIYGAGLALTGNHDWLYVDFRQPSHVRGSFTVETWLKTGGQDGVSFLVAGDSFAIAVYTLGQIQSVSAIHHYDGDCLSGASESFQPHTSPEECAQHVLGAPQCPDIFMYNYHWGCRCCKTADTPLTPDDNWDIYRVLKDTAQYTSLSMWLLVFVPTSTPVECSDTPSVLTASTGVIGDGSGPTPRVGSGRCAWIIAPEGAEHISLVFTSLNMFVGADFLYLYSCLEIACPDGFHMCMNGNPNGVKGQQLLSMYGGFCDRDVDCYGDDNFCEGGSRVVGCITEPIDPPTPCESKSAGKMITGGDLPAPFTSSTGVMLVELQYSTEDVQRGAGFSATYAASFSHLQLDPSNWHHIAVTVQDLGSHTDPAAETGSFMNVHVNGSMLPGTKLEYDPEQDPPFEADHGTAIGRGAPGWQSAGDFGHFHGALDTMRFWNEARTSEQIKSSMFGGCQIEDFLSACYTFDSDVTNSSARYINDDSGNGFRMYTASASSPHLPWCMNMDDDGEDEVVNNCKTRSHASDGACHGPMSHKPPFEMWGFCNDKPRLPGAGFDYSAKTMQTALKHVNQTSISILAEYPGCGALKFRLMGNMATQYGGAIYYDSCISLSVRCFVDGLDPISSSKSIFFKNNLAPSGGAIFVKCSSLGLCAQRFGRKNVIGSLPSVPKAEFAANRAEQYGNDIATIAATVGWHQEPFQNSSKIELIPGQDSLDVFVLLYDSLGTQVKGSTDVVELTICPITSTPCSASAATVAPQYSGLHPGTGLVSLHSPIKCSIGSTEMLFGVGVVGAADVPRIYRQFSCKECEIGQVYSRDEQTGTWYCTFCKPGSYSLVPLASPPGATDPGCINCPAGGVCTHGGSSVQFMKGAWDIVGSMYVLRNCPRGHKVINSSLTDDTIFAHDRQMCEVCAKGEECDKEACVSCSLCAPGFYKQTASTEACAPCPANTYRENEGATELGNCVPCQAKSSTNGGKQSSRRACECDEEYYLITSHAGTADETLACRTCPKGGECQNRNLGCGLRTSPRVCPIVGDWLRDASSDEYMLVGCPVGYKLENASGHDNLECQKCLEGFYVQDPRSPRDICRRCPSSGTCVNGAPPIFQAAKVTGKIQLAGLPEEGIEDAVRQALADLLGVDISQIVLPEQARRQQRRGAARTIVFEIVGDAAQAAELAADLKTGNLAAQLSSQLSQTYNMNISAQVSGGDVAETAEKRPEGEKWEEVDGQYLLRKCPQGFLLVNTTVELSMCRECDAATYSFRDSDGCNEQVHPTVCDTRECTACPVGATCAKGSDEASRHFVPKALKIGDRVHAVAILRRDDTGAARFFCDQQTQACAPLDLSLPAHAVAAASDDGSYVWEYVKTCTFKTQPCSPQHAPSILLRRCPAGTVLINSTQSRGFDPALQECSPCGRGNYIVNPFFGPCLKCPEGADCPDGAQFIPKVEGSKWELAIMDDGLRTKRLTECPIGFALERKQSNPQADRCVACPGSSDAAYSLRIARWSGNESITGVGVWCERCPSPASSVSCAENNLVTGKEGWWLVEEEEPVEEQNSRRYVPPIKHVLRTYKCDPGVCMANNTCANGRIGVACGSCPDDPQHVLTVGICTRCPGTSPDQLWMWRAIFCVVGGSIVAVAWFILCWAPVFGTTSMEIFMKWFGWPIRMFNRSKALVKKSKALAKKKKQAQDFLSNPKNLKLFQQYLKVFIAYGQVLGSFVGFKVEWPIALGKTIGWVMNVSMLLKFDFMNLPGLACIWASYSYTAKAYVQLATPILVALFLAIPVPVAFSCAKRAAKKRKPGSHAVDTPDAARELEATWKERYERTVDVFWNNIMFWLFIIFPGTSLTVLQTFICRRIYRDTYLIASMYKEECPWGGLELNIWRLDTWQPLTIVSFVFIWVYPFGVPLIMLLLMRYNGVPRLAQEKIANSLVTSMIGEYLKTTTTSSSLKLASFIGFPPSMEKEVDSNSKDEAADAEFDRRTEEVFVEIFPDHEHCSDACCGHQLPEMPMKILNELKYPGDVAALAFEVRNWFARIDLDGSRSLDGDEVLAEMTRIGLTSEQAKQILQYHKNATGRAELGVDDLINALMHVLGNAIPALSAYDMVTIGHLFTKFDENGDGNLDLTEFRQLALELLHSSYAFTGRETLDSLDLVQLNVLRKYNWKRREAQELKDGQEANNAQNAMDAKKQTFDAEATNEPKSPSDEEEHQPMYRETKAQKKKLEAICLAMQSICKRLLAADTEFCERAQALILDEDGAVSADIIPFSLELKSKLQQRLFVDVDTDASGRVSFQEFCAMFSGQGADRSELRATFDRLDVNKEGTLTQSELSMYMLEATFPPDNGDSRTISRGPSSKRTPSRRRRADMDALRDAKEIYGALVEVESQETALRDICLENVIDIAFKLQKEGVVVAPPLEWDGSLGPEEEKVINRLGFLLNAYTVQAWWWELVEMLRKLILTVALAALYKGEPPQLGGSLFTIFCFLLGHLLLKPYLNQGLNVFQRLALVSQFFTVFGSLMFVVQEATAKNNAATEDLNGKQMISFLIIFANAAAGGLYPLYRFVTAWAESGAIDFSFIANSIKSGAEKCLGPEVVASLVASCTCLSKAKEKADIAEAEVRRLRTNVDDMRQHELVSTAEGRYNDASEAKKQVDEARAVHQDIKSGVAGVRSAGADLRAEASETRARSKGVTIEEDQGEIQEVGAAPVDGDRAAREAVSYQHPGGFSPAGYVPRAPHDPEARPTPSPRALEQPPIVFESIRVVSSDVVFRQASPRLQYLNEEEFEDGPPVSDTHISFSVPNSVTKINPSGPDRLSTLDRLRRASESNQSRGQQ